MVSSWVMIVAERGFGWSPTVARSPNTAPLCSVVTSRP